jgi:hypothetical protein
MVNPHAQAPSWKLITLTIAADIRAGFVEITRHGMAALGLAVAAVVITFAARPDLLAEAHTLALGWAQLQQNEGPTAPVEPGAGRSTAVPTQSLTPEQLSVTQWLSRKYRISPEPLGALVTEAWAVGERSQLPPTLILAVIAVESNFNPFAQRGDQRQGLMQIDGSAQLSILNGFGGPLSAFDPVTNLRVGSRLLQGFIQEAGSIEEGLQAYARTSPQAGDSNYPQRVLGEYRQLEQLVQPREASASSPAPGASGRQ